MTLNVNNPTPITLADEVLRYVDRFTYLGSVFTKGGGADEDVNRRLSKARTPFGMLEPVWRSSQYSNITKIKLYQSCIVSVLLYGSECWKMTQSQHLPYQKSPKGHENLLATDNNKRGAPTEIWKPANVTNYNEA